MLFYKYLSPKVRSGWIGCNKTRNDKTDVSTAHKQGVSSQLLALIDSL